MKELKTVVIDSVGLHARPARLFVGIAKKYESVIKVKRKDNEKEVNAKSILLVLTLAAVKGTELIISIDGPDEEEAALEIGEFFANNLLEEE